MLDGAGAATASAGTACARTIPSRGPAVQDATHQLTIARREEAARRKHRGRRHPSDPPRDGRAPRRHGCH